MAVWWTSLSVAMKVLWGITIAASLTFVIESILTFIGADAEFDTDFDPSGADMDASLDGDLGMNLLTFRNFVNFFLGFGWTAVLLRNRISSTAVLMILAVAVGVVLVISVMYLFKGLSHMQQSGNINIESSAVGCHGTVYIPIPATRSGEGKVQITINNAVREYNAVTDGEDLPTGVSIEVVDVIGNDTLVVEKPGSLII
ncbi:MAG: NfeD family protein [Bacteroidales bacterium]|nr:NfeD family protein [Bacteroidales bacterium]